jgi:molybdopterin-guanine dinucleotide biosynthesis protein MobB
MSILPIKAVSIVGWSGSGKTTLSEALVAALSRGGGSVATIKKTSHPLPADRADSDTDRFNRAGSRRIALVSPEATLLRTSNPLNSEDLNRFFSDCDYLVSEGFFLSGAPCIELIGNMSGTQGPKRETYEVSAYVLTKTSSPPPFVEKSDKPLFRAEATEEIIRFLEDLWNAK